MASSQTVSTAPATEYAAHFGKLIKERREHIRMRQDDLALASGVGRRFLIELEAGKPSCQLGKALAVAMVLGLRPFDMMTMDSDSGPALPDLPDDMEDAHGR